MNFSLLLALFALLVAAASATDSASGTLYIKGETPSIVFESSSGSNPAHDGGRPPADQLRDRVDGRLASVKERKLHPFQDLCTILEGSREGRRARKAPRAERESGGRWRFMCLLVYDFFSGCSSTRAP